MRFFFALFLCLLSVPSAAAGSPAADETWHRLGQWQGRPGSMKSVIVTEDFFLAEDGRTDPEAELEATLAALRGPLGRDPDGHALCRYPARAIHLQGRLSLGLPDPFEACPALRAWAADGDVRGVSLLFVAGYFSNPGSAFGHILLRLHTGEGSLEVEDVLDRAINYGAAASEEDALIPYIAKGLTGRYRSTYSSLDFYHHSERFREEQLRDVWQYRLDLGEDETRFLTAHLWELLRAENRYYFLRQNCAFRVATLLELVVDRDLVPGSKAWMAPVDAFHALTRSVPGKAVPVAAVKRLSSRETRFAEGYGRLRPAEQGYVDRVIAAPPGPIPAGNLGDGRRAEALGVLLDYYAFAAKEDPSLEPREAQILRARFALPPSREAAAEPPVPPHAGQPSSMVRLSAVTNDAQGPGAALRIRPAYFDFLSATEGTSPYSELFMADLTLLTRGDTVHLRRLEAVRVTSLNLAPAGAPDRNARAWRFRVGAETKTLACDDCLLGYLEAGLGEAVELRPGVAAYGLISARFEAGDEVNSHAGGLLTGGLVLRGKRAALALEGGFQQGADRPGLTLPYGQAELRLGSGRRWDLRARAAQREAFELGLGVSAYW